MLVSAAAEMFAEKGYRATTFQDVAERAGISRGSIPWHFGNKEGLLKAVVDDFSETAFATHSQVESLGDLIDALFEVVRRPTSKLLITLVAEAVEPASPLNTFYRDMHAALRKWLVDHVGEVGLPAGVDRSSFVAVLTSSVIGMHQQWRVAPDDFDLDAAIATLKTILGASTPRRRPSRTA
jgi:TetR/AcrR family acrAB operon transcriptional repressor